MIKLSQVFEALQYGELANVSLSGSIDAPKGIGVKDYPILISHINMALNDLHTRFHLKEREVTVQQYDYLAFYKLNSMYARTTPQVGSIPNYIIDTEENPFTDDIIRVNTIMDECGAEYVMNDDDNPCSLYLPNYDTIIVPNPCSDNAMFVTYKAKHTEIPLTTTDASSVEVGIPIFMLEALLAYVASRVHSARISQESVGLAVTFMNKYQTLCSQYEHFNLLNAEVSFTNNKLGGRGWV